MTRDRPEIDPRPARAINPTLYSPKPPEESRKKIEQIIEIDTTGVSGLIPNFKDTITAALTSLKAVSDADRRSLATAQNNQQYHNTRRARRI